MKVTNRIKDLWDTGTRQATSLSRSEEQTQNGWGDWLARQLGQHPTVTLGVGLVMGVAIGWLIKRR
jgi:hypothetical protein